MLTFGFALWPRDAVHDGSVRLRRFLQVCNMLEALNLRSVPGKVGSWSRKTGTQGRTSVCRLAWLTERSELSDLERIGWSVSVLLGCKGLGVKENGCKVVVI